MATATKKPAARKPAAKKAAPIPASENAPRYQVVDQVFVWRDEEQGEVRIPLRFKMKLLRMLVRLEKDEGASEMEQLFALLDAINDEATRDQIDEMWIDDATGLISAYFDEFSALNEATPGE